MGEKKEAAVIPTLCSNELAKASSERCGRVIQMWLYIESYHETSGRYSETSAEGDCPTHPSASGASFSMGQQTQGRTPGQWSRERTGNEEGWQRAAHGARAVWAGTSRKAVSGIGLDIRPACDMSICFEGA